MKYKIAYVDENDGWLNTFYQTFKNDFEVLLVKVETTSSVDEIVKYLFSIELDAIVTDYLLEEEANVSFNGNKIVESIRNLKPHFPIIMLTAHESQAINHMDDVHIIYGKDILDGESEEELTLFKAKINSNIANYYNKIEHTHQRVEELSKKKNEAGLDIPEEDELTRLLILIDEFEPEGKDMPANLILPASITKLNEFVSETREIIAELRKAKESK
jgi:hypothetical protein